MHRRQPLALGAAGCFAGVAALWLLVEYVGPFPGDQRAAAAAANGPPIGLDLQIVSFFGQLGTEAVAAMTVLVACAALWSALGLRAAAWVLGASLAILANNVLKAALGPTPLAPDLSESDTLAPLRRRLAARPRRHLRPHSARAPAQRKILIACVGATRPATILGGYFQRSPGRCPSMLSHRSRRISWTA